MSVFRGTCRETQGPRAVFITFYGFLLYSGGGILVQHHCHASFGGQQCPTSSWLPSWPDLSAKVRCAVYSTDHVSLHVNVECSDRLQRLAALLSGE
jgi:hypothetical protein